MVGLVVGPGVGAAVVGLSVGLGVGALVVGGVVVGGVVVGAALVGLWVGLGVGDGVVVVLVGDMVGQTMRSRTASTVTRLVVPKVVMVTLPVSSNKNWPTKS